MDTFSALEHFIRAKYEHKKYVDKNYVKPPVRVSMFFMFVDFLIKKG